MNVESDSEKEEEKDGIFENSSDGNSNQEKVNIESSTKKKSIEKTNGLKRKFDLVDGSVEFLIVDLNLSNPLNNVSRYTVAMNSNMTYIDLVYNQMVSDFELNSEDCIFTKLRVLYLANHQKISFIEEFKTVLFNEYKRIFLHFYEK